MKRTKGPPTKKERKLSDQVKDRIHNTSKPKEEISEGFDTVSTGSTLLDLAISGGATPGGGIPGGILVEAFGPAGCGKTILLCEIAGGIQRQGGDIMFYDPEARLNKRFAKLFGIEMDKVTYGMPSTIPELFQPIRKWKPETKGQIHGVMADSLTALTTEMEMEDKDKFGMRRAKEFSEELRKTCRILQQRNVLLVCTNQVRQKIDAGPYEQKYHSPGGEAIGFYSSLRLRFTNPVKIKKKVTVRKKEVTRIIGVTSLVEIYKSSIWKPYRSALITIIFDYGVDDVRQNLQFIKKTKGATTYRVGSKNLGNSMELAIKKVEELELELKLKEETIKLWMEVEKKFETSRKKKFRSHRGERSLR